MTETTNRDNVIKSFLLGVEWALSTVLLLGEVYNFEQLDFDIIMEKARAIVHSKFSTPSPD